MRLMRSARRRKSRPAGSSAHGSPLTRRWSQRRSEQAVEMSCQSSSSIAVSMASERAAQPATAHFTAVALRFIHTLRRSPSSEIALPLAVTSWPFAMSRPLVRTVLTCYVIAATSALQLSANPRLQQRAGSRKCDAEVWLPAEVPCAAIRAATRMQDDDGPSSFAEYLVPYALAVVAALLATSAFFAFLNGAI